jgi:hypothetical protein
MTERELKLTNHRSRRRRRRRREENMNVKLWKGERFDEQLISLLYDDDDDGSRRY